MNKHYKKILLEFDELGSYETPKNFNYRELNTRIIKLKEDLEQEFKEIFINDSQVQDASFYCDLIIPEKLINDPTNNFKYAIRISNFGNLATFTFDEQDVIDSGDKLIKKLEDFGFMYVPNQELDKEYDGRFEDFKNILGSENRPSWWIRYFDYL